MDRFREYRCPRCGSENVRVYVERDRNSYDFCGGILGYICAGPLGLLCGFCGSQDKERTTLICNDCDAHFTK